MSIYIYIYIYIYLHTYIVFIIIIIVRNLCRGVKAHKLITMELATGVSITDRKLEVTVADVTIPQTLKSS